MALTLYYHPFASYCWKALIALYENDTPFTPHDLDLGDPKVRAEFNALSPFGKMPLLKDGETLVSEATVVIEHLALHHPGKVELIPREARAALPVRHRDRVFDLYVQESMQKIVGDRLRPEGAKDPFGVAQARATLRTAYALIEGWAAEGPWIMGEAFTLADCAAAPALHYAQMVEPFGADLPNTTAYLARLKARPSFARVLEEAAPYNHFFPKE